MSIFWWLYKEINWKCAEFSFVTIAIFFLSAHNIFVLRNRKEVQNYFCFIIFFVGVDNVKVSICLRLVVLLYMSYPEDFFLGGIRNCLKFIPFNKILKTGLLGKAAPCDAVTRKWEGQDTETLLIAFRSWTLISKVWGNQESVNVIVYPLILQSIQIHVIFLLALLHSVVY